MKPFDVVIRPPSVWSAVEIRRFRDALKLKQRQFATLLGVSLPLVRAWEQNVRAPHPSHARLLDTLSADDAMIGYAAQHYLQYEVNNA